ncbi:winged helix-turn-helix domain-containing protein [Vibrio mimicus]|nr:winged helix-turn-helix domain-containing protein [Vibrio mimicus]QXC57803.1 winged helix-turn-helix domain-containing protein [Vibrio mimicus]
MKNILSQAKKTHGLIAIGSLRYNVLSRQLCSKTEVIELEPRSTELLEILLDHVGVPLSADKIIELVWQSKFISRNVLTNRISLLRTILKQHDPDLDVNRVLITYPKKGYFFNQDKVYLINPEPLAEVVDTKRERVSHQPSHWKTGLVVLLLCCLSAFMGYSFFHLQQAKIPQYDDRAPVVELLLNSIKAADPYAKKYLLSIKTLLLNEQINYPYTSLANQDAPNYFLTPLDETHYWPGAKSILSSDYKLDLELRTASEGDQLLAVLKISHYPSQRVVYQESSKLDPESLEKSVHELNQMVVAFFNLPEWDAPLSATPSINQLVNQPLEITLQQMVQRGHVNELEAGYISRALLSQKKIQPTVLKSWLNVVETSFQFHSEETGIWLGLLYYRSEDFNIAHEYLVKTHFNNQVDNAFLYLILSDIALEQKQANDFRNNYLKSMVALTRTIPSEQIFQRLSQRESRDTCLAPWDNMFKKANIQEQLTPWQNRFSDYCTKAERYLY